ncbi:MAG: hypothetical protein Q7R56_00230 [Nanoarchaeota archaeon]|nr:hypothetical protein [Nanoarchaeota archaeon]
MNYYNLGVFLEGGGIKTFYSDGVLTTLQNNKIFPDYYVGISASAGMMLGHIYNCSNEILELFGKKCDQNKKNFYLFKKEHFPHNRMMEGALNEIFKEYISSLKKRNGDYAIIAAQTPKKWEHLQYTLSLLFMFLRTFHINLLTHFGKLCKAKMIILTSQETKTNKEIVNFIMGSATVYPFIKPHYLNNSLLLESHLLDFRYESTLKNCKKGIIIYTTKGITRREGNILHLYPTQRLPYNPLDYTSKQKLLTLRKIGEQEGELQLVTIKQFLKD